MRILKTAAALIASASLAASAAAGAQVWDFENNDDGWAAANGTWVVGDGVYQQTDAAMVAAHTLVGDPEWTDYEVSVDMRIDNGNYAGLIFRAVDEFQYYVYYLNAAAVKSEIWRHTPGAFNSRVAIDSNIQPQEGVQIVRNEWINLKVVVEGDSIQLLLNDELQSEKTDGNYGAGAIGLWSWTTVVSFDNLTVTGDGIQNTLSVDPRQKLALQWANLKR